MTHRLPTLAALALCVALTSAQQPPPKQPPQPRLEAPPPAPAEEPVYDPLRAEKAIEVGRFYFKRGNFDAALERFQDAARFRPGYAIPYRWMGQTYEKMRRKPDAVTAYRKYLELYPSAQDAAKIRKRIEKLEKEIARVRSL